tara:strand:- start:1746 stop:3086 length:1341 start_codon:yes stop_codon:yes gene_type:complete
MLGLGGGLSFSGAPSVPVPNPIRNALTLVADDYLTFPLSTSAYWENIFHGSFSIGVWIKPTDGVPSSQEYVYGSAFRDSSNLVHSIGLSFQAATGKILFSHNCRSDFYTEISSSQLFANGQSDWVHVLVVSQLNEGGNTDDKIYVNGELHTTTAVGALTSANHKLFDMGNHTIRVGGVGNDGNYGATSNGMVGSLDEFAVWDDTLTAAEVLAVYNSAKPFDLNAASSDGNYPTSAASDLQVYLRMGDGTNDNITPLTGNQIEILNQAINPTAGVEMIVNGNFSSTSSTESGGLDTYSGFKEIVADEITMNGGFMQIGQTVVANGNATAVALAANGSTDVLAIGAGAYGYILKYEIEEKGAGFVGLSAIIGGTTYALPEEVGHNTAYLTSGSANAEFQLINEHVADEAADNCHVILENVSLKFYATNQTALGVGVSGLDTETYNDLA